LPNADDPLIEGREAMALPVGNKLESAALLLEMSQIPVVTQESHNGKYFHNQLWHPWLISALILRPLSYFIYSIHTHLLGLSQLQDLITNHNFEVTLSPNGSIVTMATTPMAAMASHITINPPASVGQ
jgi:hypothetical protein